MVRTGSDAGMVAGNGVGAGRRGVVVVGAWLMMVEMRVGTLEGFTFWMMVKAGRSRAVVGVE